MQLEVTTLTRDQQLAIGYLCYGNSALDLCMQLLEAISEPQYREILKHAVKDVKLYSEAYEQVLESGGKPVAG